MNKSRKGSSIDCSIKVMTVILEYFEHIPAHFWSVVLPFQSWEL